MRSVAIAALAFIAVSTIGCKSKQDQLAEVYAQLDTMNTQYQKDCTRRRRLCQLPQTHRTQQAAFCRCEREFRCLH